MLILNPNCLNNNIARKYCILLQNFVLKFDFTMFTCKAGGTKLIEMYILVTIISKVSWKLVML